jgi:hypothetical protein
MGMLDMMKILAEAKVNKMKAEGNSLTAETEIDTATKRAEFLKKYGYSPDPIKIKPIGLGIGSGTI